MLTHENCCRVAELEEQLLSLQEHACEAADVLKADKVALEAKAKRLEEHVLEMTRSRVAYKVRFCQTSVGNH